MDTCLHDWIVGSHRGLHRWKRKLVRNRLLVSTGDVVGDSSSSTCCLGQVANTTVDADQSDFCGADGPDGRYYHYLGLLFDTSKNSKNLKNSKVQTVGESSHGRFTPCNSPFLDHAARYEAYLLMSTMHHNAGIDGVFTEAFGGQHDEYFNAIGLIGVAMPTIVWTDPGVGPGTKFHTQEAVFVLNSSKKCLSASCYIRCTIENQYVC